jgi:hypothetical protein
MYTIVVKMQLALTLKALITVGAKKVTMEMESSAIHVNHEHVIYIALFSILRL